MPYLLPTVLSIILASMAITMTVNYIPIENKLFTIAKGNVELGLDVFDSASKQYQEDNVVYGWSEDCPPGSSSGDPECLHDRVISDDGRVDPANWESALVPDYMHTPPLPINWSWDMGENASGLYTCVQANTSSVSKSVFSHFMTHYPNDRLKTGASCNPSTAYSKADVSSHSDPDIYLTYWLRK